MKFFTLLMLFVLVSCGKDDNEQFVGVYTGTSLCDGEDEAYPTIITITAVDKSAEKVIVKIDSDGESESLNGTVSGDKLTIPKQVIDVNDEISGEGSLKDKTLTIAFIVDGNCTFTGSK